MDDKSYTPYCGAERCTLAMPRTTWNAVLQQFTCSCGWASQFPTEFISRYVEKHSIKPKNTIKTKYTTYRFAKQHVDINSGVQKRIEFTMDLEFEESAIAKARNWDWEYLGPVLNNQIKTT